MKVAKIVDDKNKLVRKIITVSIIVILLLIVVLLAIKIVPAGSTGVVVTLGKVSETVLPEGVHFKIPFIQRIEIVSNKIQKTEVEAAAVSRDLQSVNSVIAVNYRVALDSSASVYKNIGRDYEAIVFLPAVQESMKSVSAKYTAEELISKRAQVSQEIKESLEEKVNRHGLIIENFNIVNFEFSSEFNAAIEAKQVAEQNLIKTKTEQEQALVIAEAEAKKKVITAQAEADAITTKAKAQAEANEKLAKSLNDTLVEYEKIQKWNGEMPMVNGGNAIIDMRDNTDE